MNLREIDTLIAKHVFNLKDEDITTNNGHNEYSTAPFYTTSIVKAWEVVEKMKEKQHFIFIGHTIKNNTYFTRAEHSDNYYIYKENYIFGDTMPIAVCKCALNALGVEL